MEKNSSAKPARFIYVIREYWHIAFLILIISLFTLNTAYFIANDRSPIISDSGEHLPKALQVFKNVPKRHGIDKLKFFSFEYPPLVYVVGAIFFHFFGVSIQSALWSIYPFSVLMILMFFAIGNHFGGKLGGVAATLIGTANCYFINFSHVFLLDITHASLTCLAFNFLLKSDMFRKPLPSYLFGIAFGFALLSRFSTVFYICGPLLLLSFYFAFKSFRLFLLSLFFGGCINGMLYFFLLLGKENMAIS